MMSFLCNEDMERCSSPAATAVAFVPYSPRPLYPQSLLIANSSPSATQADEIVDLGTLIEAHISDDDVELAEAKLRGALKKGASRPPPETF